MRHCLIIVLGVAVGVFVGPSASVVAQEPGEMPVSPMEEAERVTGEAIQPPAEPATEASASQEAMGDAVRGGETRGIRNPFWTVGWWPSNGALARVEGPDDGPGPPPPAIAVDWDAAEKALQTLKPVSMSGPKGQFVRIGTQVVGIGDAFSLAYKGSLYFWKVVDLKKGLEIDRQNVRPIR